MRFMAVHVVVRAALASGARRADAWTRRPARVLLLGSGLAACAVGVLIASPRTLRPSHRYAVGEFASAAIRAPWDISVYDDVATVRMREDAALHTPPVARVDPRPTTDLPARISEVFSRARDLIARADSQRQVPADELRRLSAAARRRLQQSRAREADLAVQAALQEMVAQAEVQIGVALTPEERTLLAAGRFDRRLENGLLALLREAYGRPIALDVRQLREAAERSQRSGEPPRLVLRTGSPGTERVLPDAAILDSVPGAITRLRSRASYLLPDSTAPEQELLAGLAARLVTPDTAYDEAATAERRARAAADVLPVSLNFRRNQLIVGEGREVTREALLVLDHLRQEGLPQAFLGRAAGAAALLWLLLAALLWLPHRLGFARAPLRDGVFTLATVVMATAVLWVWLLLVDGVSARAPDVPRIGLLLLFPATAVPILAGLVLPRPVVLGLLVVVAVPAGLLTDLGILYAGHTLIVGLAAAQLVARCLQRSCIIRAGVYSGMAATVSAIGVVLLAGGDGGVGGAAASLVAAFAGAAAGALAALAFSRPLEWTFGYSTRLRLVELLSYDHPLLRRLMDRAPGTFQHSVAVALLARSGAEAISADALLARVGALYHDVGKLESPQLFSENQHDGNPHDGMEPRESARAIVEHTARGVRLLEQYDVGERIADFVREHQGTGVLAYFERKAREGGGRVDAADFRYPGPRPRSRETAVVMIADKIEASARALDDPGPQSYQSVVGKTIDDLQSSGELDESPLTTRDLAALRSAFVAALTDLHHKRPPYMKPPASASGGPGALAS
jgi:cyclic-di-AMP phosphodiesterase PgpH